MAGCQRLQRRTLILALACQAFLIDTLGEFSYGEIELIWILKLLQEVIVSKFWPICLGS